MPQLSAWDNFYVIVGSAAGAMIGLQFVVITLVVELRQRTSADTIRAFGTSTVVHFAGAFLISALMSVPWTSLAPLSLALGLCGMSGVGYSLMGVRRAQRQKQYQPVRSDLVWFFFLPIAGYVVLLLGALVLGKTAALPLFLIGAAALGLVFIGIRNVWDSVTYMIVTGRHSDQNRSNR
jgi:hypothetical protein